MKGVKASKVDIGTILDAVVAGGKVAAKLQLWFLA